MTDRNLPHLVSNQGATAALASLAAGLKWEAQDQDVRIATKRAVTEAVACGVAGSGTPLARLARATLGTPSPREATLLGQGGRTTALMAAHHNALAINALDYDDQGPFGGHPGPAVFAAALATAERIGSSGRDMLAAVLAGYETAMRVQAAIRPSGAQYARAHGNGTPLAFGAAAAAGRLLGLDDNAMRAAFGIAGSLSPVAHAGKFGWEEATLPWVKDNVAWPAEAGVRSALLAAAGMPASTTIFDGDTGFWRMAASDRCDWATLLDPQRRHILDLTFKPYPCCRWLHPMLVALGRIKAKHRIEPWSVQRVDVATTGFVVGQLGRHHPKTMVDGQFSAPYVIAALLDTVPRSEWWKVEAQMARPTFQRLADAVSLNENPQLTARHRRSPQFPVFVPAQVTVTEMDGAQYTDSALEASGPWGATPQSQAEQRAKIFELLHTFLDGDASTEIVDMIGHLETLPDCTSLTMLVTTDRGQRPHPFPHQPLPRKDPR